jgi:hypothetical protein
MRVYKTPILNKSEQKAIGGILSYRQLAYGLGGGLFAYDLTSRLYGVIGPGALLLFPAIWGFFLLMAFFKVPRLEMDLDSYLMLKLKFFLTQKEFKYRDF